MNGDKKYCFTEQEFWALAGSVGIQKLYGFLPEAEADLKKFDEKIVYQLLFQMTNKKFLEAEENRYRMHPELRELFGYIKSASGVLTIYSMSGSFSNKCIYLSDNIVLVEEGGINARFLKACFGAREDILDIALEGILPKQNVADDLLYQKENADLEKLQDKELVIFLEQMGSQEE
ncbi:MAG: hypothetical protein IKM28_05685 [Lachnospiraceae bacterium]|nr:hypothetical protein [Lachnospiraceae bacterium]